MPKKRPATPYAHLNVRVSRDLLEEIRLAAMRDDRSLNSFVNASIRRQLQQLIPERTTKLERGGGKR